MNHETPEWEEAQEAIDWIHSLTNLGMKPGLKRMEWMLDQVGHPEQDVAVVHIGGTNGKGSTLSFVRHVLQAANYRVGTFTSPYIVRFQERIQINGQYIEDHHLLQLTKKVYPLVKRLERSEWSSPTEFEVITALALLYFQRMQPDFVLVEVGLGGRFDSTNVVTPLLSIITNVGYDHTHILGERIEDIAFEKAGIIKRNVPVVTGIEDQRSLRVIQEQAWRMEAPLYTTSSYHLQQEYVQQGELPAEGPFSYRSTNHQFDQLQKGLMGPHQMKNAGLAIKALEILKEDKKVVWTESQLREGLRQTTWPGRLEIVRNKPLVLLDGAHNPQGMQAVADTLHHLYGRRSITAIYTGMKDKDQVNMIRELAPVLDKLIITEFPFPRCASAASIYAQVSQSEHEWQMELSINQNWRSAYEQQLSMMRDQDVLLFIGSLYFISDVRKIVLNTHV